MTQTHSGACLCRAVTFTTNAPLRDVIYCHCSQCRKQTGLYYAATNVPNDRLTMTGAENIRWFEASPHARRGFCQQCGSALFWQLNGAADTSVLAGAFDAPTGLVGSVHIFTSDKGDFYQITDDLPQFTRSAPRHRCCG